MAKFLGISIPSQDSPQPDHAHTARTSEAIILGRRYSPRRGIACRRGPIGCSQLRESVASPRENRCLITILCTAFFQDWRQGPPVPAGPAWSARGWRNLGCDAACAWLGRRTDRPACWCVRQLPRRLGGDAPAQILWAGLDPVGDRCQPARSGPGRGRSRHSTTRSLRKAAWLRARRAARVGRPQAQSRTGSMRSRMLRRLRCTRREHSQGRRSRATASNCRQP